VYFQHGKVAERPRLHTSHNYTGCCVCPIAGAYDDENGVRELHGKSRMRGDLLSWDSGNLRGEQGVSNSVTKWQM
jgi:hypothetical protein